MKVELNKYTKAKGEKKQNVDRHRNKNIASTCKLFFFYLYLSCIKDIYIADKISVSLTLRFDKAFLN